MTTVLLVLGVIAGIAAFLALLIVGIRALERVEQRADQIFREEIDAHRQHDEFGMQVRPVRHDPTDTGETR